MYFLQEQKNIFHNFTSSKDELGFEHVFGLLIARCLFVFLSAFFNQWLELTYLTRAIITHGLYAFYPLFEVQKRSFKELFS